MSLSQNRPQNPPQAKIADLVRARRPAMPITVAGRPQPIRLDMNRCALVIIDMQNDFCSPGGWFEARGIDLSAYRALFPAMNRLTVAARANGMPVIWLNWGTRPDLLNMHPAARRIARPFEGDAGYRGRMSGDKGPVLESGSWGAAICPELTTAESDIVVLKHRLSGFWDNEFDSILRNLDITALLIGGVNLDRCVAATIQDASFSGYDPVLVEDAAATCSPQFCIESTLFLIERLYGFVVTSGAIISAIEAATGAPHRSPQT
jgi:nicotinamidase-related amidase